jgi:hypothetical protein
MSCWLQPMARHRAQKENAPSNCGVIVATGRGTRWRGTAKKPFALIATYAGLLPLPNNCVIAVSITWRLSGLMM